MATTHSNVYFTNKIKAEQKTHNIMKINKKIYTSNKEKYFPVYKKLHKRFNKNNNE